MEIAGHFRRKGRRPREVELSGEEDGGETPLNATPPEPPDRATLSRERRDLVHATLDLLPPHYGRVLEFKYLEELSVKAIARRMDMSAKAVESLLTRARGAFREVYARQLDRSELRLNDS